MSKYVITIKKDKDVGEDFWKQGSVFTFDAIVAEDFEEAVKIFRESIVSLKVSVKKEELKNVFYDDYEKFGKQIFDLVNGVCKDTSFVPATSLEYSDSDWDSGMGFEINNKGVAIQVPFALRLLR